MCSNPATSLGRVGYRGPCPRPGPPPLLSNSPFSQPPRLLALQAPSLPLAPSGPLQLTKEAPGWIWGHRRHQSRPMPLKKLVGIS